MTQPDLSDAAPGLIKMATADGALRRSLLTALVVGTILTAINQGDVNATQHQRARDLLATRDGGPEAFDMERVMTLVRRLRKKFREVDPEFDRIVLVPGCGYRWRAPAAAEV